MALVPLEKPLVFAKDVTVKRPCAVLVVLKGFVEKFKTTASLTSGPVALEQLHARSMQAAKKTKPETVAEGVMVRLRRKPHVHEGYRLHRHIVHKDEIARSIFLVY